MRGHTLPAYAVRGGFKPTDGDTACSATRLCDLCWWFRCYCCIKRLNGGSAHQVAALDEGLLHQRHFLRQAIQTQVSSASDNTNNMHFAAIAFSANGPAFPLQVLQHMTMMLDCTLNLRGASWLRLRLCCGFMHTWFMQEHALAQLI